VLENLSNYGVAAIFIYAAYKLYVDMRADSTIREEKLMAHLDKQAATMTDISDTLKKLDYRICALEVKRRKTHE
jgi:hypothetical protein